MGPAGGCDMIRRERSYWFSTLGAALLYVFVGMTFHTKTQIEHTLTVRYCNHYSTTTTPKSTTSSPVVTKRTSDLILEIGLVGIALNLSGLSEMGSFLIIVVKI